MEAMMQLQQRYEAFAMASSMLLSRSNWKGSSLFFVLNAVCKRICDLDLILGDMSSETMEQAFALVQIEFGRTLSLLTKWVGTVEALAIDACAGKLRHALEDLWYKYYRVQFERYSPKFLLSDRSYIETFQLTNTRRPSNSGSDSIEKLVKYIQKVEKRVLARIINLDVLPSAFVNYKTVVDVAAETVSGQLKYTGERFNQLASAKFVTDVRMREADPRTIFEINDEDVIGEGAYGKVYKAKHLKFGGTFAVKVVFTAENRSETEVEILRYIGHYTEPEERRRKLEAKLLKEAKMLATCTSSAFIVDFGGYFFHDDLLYLFTSFCSRGSVRHALIKRGRGFGEETVKYILLSVLSAVAYMHERRVYHGDLKSENILVDESGVVQLCDFGNAYKEDDERDPDSSCGTLHFMAPEIINAYWKSEDEAPPRFGLPIDIWAFGIVAIELVNGEPPMSQTPYNDVALAIKFFEIKQEKARFFAFTHSEAVSLDLKDMASRCLVRDVAKRATAMELVEGKYLKHCEMNALSFIHELKQ